MENTVERLEEKKLKDGRTIFKTANGFKFWVESKRGLVSEVNETYYKKAKRLEER